MKTTTALMTAALAAAPMAEAVQPHVSALEECRLWNDPSRLPAHPYDARDAKEAVYYTYSMGWIFAEIAHGLPTTQSFNTLISPDDPTRTREDPIVLIDEYCRDNPSRQVSNALRQVMMLRMRRTEEINRALFGEPASRADER